jgi:hypothetical protein
MLRIALSAALVAALTVTALPAPAASTSAPGEGTVGHRLHVRLEPPAGSIEVQATVRLPEGAAAAGTRFELHEGLSILAATPPVEVIGEPEGHLRSYRLMEEAPEGVVELHYAGLVSHDLGDQREEYTRGFRETVGSVGPEGVYLDGGTRWVPRFGDHLVTFDLQVEAPPGWHVISQGSGSSGNGDGQARWASEDPLEQVYLVGGPLVRWTDSAGAVETLVYLHEEDQALATKYLDTTARYLEMYRGLLGPYPYDKFALVENFWETGYGMPSFTLLGPEVIRFPFILHSSYPHEILHNWWGNSVFVDAERGNWCEGLTAYMADHLVQEQRGLAAAYRRDTLKKYRDHVREARDFPLVEFRSRHSAATEAVGYGKSLMLFHMLRRELGDEAFVQGLADFYRSRRGQRASFDDLRTAFEGRSGEDLTGRFRQWTERTGAPELALVEASAHPEPKGDGWHVLVRVAQRQAGEPYDLEVPVVITTEGGVVERTLAMEGAAAAAREYRLDARPVAVAVDPAFDLFRLLHPLETPPSLSQVFGAPRVLALLPSAASEEELARYRGLVSAWGTPDHEVMIRRDDEIAELPEGTAVWVLGARNRFADRFEGWRPEALAVLGGEERLLQDSGALAEHSLVVVRRHPRDDEAAVAWLVCGRPAAADGLVRKLPHYGKYSFLAFEGDEPTNVLKGQWGAGDSPLVASLMEGVAPEPRLQDRRALAELPPAFSRRALAEHVEWLAAPERDGRVPGSAGLVASADYIAARFEAAGLEPAGDGGGWFQSFELEEGPDGTPVQVKNVVGRLPGSEPGWKGQSVVLSAHYDHLGRGWPEVRESERGKLHRGADDNASGVAVMIELARALASEGGGRRDLLVVAFTAEECGLRGSRHFVAHPPSPLEGMWGVLNLDAVGGLGDAPLSIHGTGTTYEWPHVFRGCGFVTGVPSRNISGDAQGSDQWSFIEAGVPGVQITTGAGPHYHRSSDIPETVDLAGLVKVATFVKEAVVYLLDREEPLQVTLEGTRQEQRTTGPRRVSFGSIPEYGYQGGGMRLEGVSEGSPAERAGLRAGDVLIGIDEIEIEDTRGFAEVLGTLKEGQTVTAVVLRDGEELRFRVTLVAR